jgi:hypothetical protein
MAGNFLGRFRHRDRTMTRVKDAQQVFEEVRDNPARQVAAPAIVANALVAAGGEIVGSSIPREPAKKRAPMPGFDEPQRGGLAGSIRFKI